MATLIVSSFGLGVMGLFAGLFPTPSEQMCTALAYGWAVASGERQTSTTSLWLTGARSVKHCSCFYRFLGGALYEARWQGWARIIRGAAQGVPAEAVIVLLGDDSLKKKAGRQIEGVGHYHNGAGSARQEYRTLRGLNFVGGSCASPCPAGRARGGVLPSGGRSPSKRRKLSSSPCPLRPAVPWRGQSWTLSRLCLALRAFPPLFWPATATL